MIKEVTHVHLEPIWYHSEHSDGPNKFLGWDIFFTVSYSKPALIFEILLELNIVPSNLKFSDTFQWPFPFLWFSLFSEIIKHSQGASKNCPICATQYFKLMIYRVIIKNTHSFKSFAFSSKFEILLVHNGFLPVCNMCAKPN